MWLNLLSFPAVLLKSQQRSILRTGRCVDAGSRKAPHLFHLFKPVLLPWWPRCLKLLEFFSQAPPCPWWLPPHWADVQVLSLLRCSTLSIETKNLFVLCDSTLIWFLFLFHSAYDFGAQLTFVWDHFVNVDNALIYLPWKILLSFCI